MRVFLSHSRENSGTASRLAGALRARGVDPWLDSEQLEGGADWQQVLAAAIDRAEGFVILVGPSPSPDPSQRFDWQHMAEREYYMDPSKPIVPIVLGSVDLPGFLRT